MTDFSYYATLFPPIVFLPENREHIGAFQQEVKKKVMYLPSKETVVLVMRGGKKSLPTDTKTAKVKILRRTRFRLGLAS